MIGPEIMGLERIEDEIYPPTDVMKPNGLCSVDPSHHRIN